MKHLLTIRLSFVECNKKRITCLKPQVNGEPKPLSPEATEGMGSWLMCNNGLCKADMIMVMMMNSRIIKKFTDVLHKI